MSRRIIIAIALGWLTVTRCAFAVDPTPTIYAGPVATPVSDRIASNQSPLYARLISAATTVNASGGLYVAGRPYKSFQVSAGATCSSYTLSIDGSVDCVHFYARQAVTNSDVAAGATKIWDFTNSDRCVRAYVSAASCTNGVTVDVGATP